METGAMIELEAAEGVHRIEHAFVNVLLLEEAGRVTVVDTGHPRSWAALLRALELAGRRPSDVEAVVLTHGHFDHVGFAARAQQELGVPVHVPRADLELAAHPWDYEHERNRGRHLLQHPRFGVVLGAMTAAGALWVKGVEDAVPYDGGDVLDVPGRPVAVATPGHTHGHCALHLPDRGVLLAGDALVTWNPYTLRAGPQVVSRAATADSGRALASLDVLTPTGADVVLTGHGPAWRGGIASAVERARLTGPT